jgi:hypothetical protein
MLSQLIDFSTPACFPEAALAAGLVGVFRVLGMAL